MVELQLNEVLLICMGWFHRVELISISTVAKTSQKQMSEVS